MTTRIRLPHNWEPRTYQLPLWQYLEDGGRRALLIAHRRWGKDDVALHFGAVSAAQKPATYWHMLPEAAQARKAIWEAVNPHSGKRRIDEAFPLQLRESTRNNEMFIRFKNGATWQVVGSDNYNSLVGSPPYGVVLSEWALANPAAYAYLSPVLAENGGWMLAITTPRGQNHAYEMLRTARGRPDWFSAVSPATETGVFTAEALAGQRQEYIDMYGGEMGRALYEQEYLCSFDAAIMGAYYGGEMALAASEGRIGAVPIDPELPVHTAWDLGAGGNMAVWFWQASGREIRVVDYLGHVTTGTGIEHYAALILAKGYRRGTDWVPHDARATEIGTGRTRIETMIRAGLQPRLVPDHGVDDGINAARITLGRCWFDAETCKAGIEALKAYRREWDEKLRTFRATAVHDWASHPADAFRYLSMAWREMGAFATAETPRVLAVGDRNTLRFSDVWRDGPRNRRRYG